MATFRTLALTLPTLVLTAAQALLPVHAAAPAASSLTREICTPQDAREAAAAPLQGSAAQITAPETTAAVATEGAPLPVQALVNLHVHETPVGITRSIAVCAAPGALPPVQQRSLPASRPSGRL